MWRASNTPTRANNPYFKTLATDDVAGFYSGLRRLLTDVCGANIQSDPDGAMQLIEQVALAAECNVGCEARLGLTLLADLNSTAELDRLWFGRGTIKGRVQPYGLIVEDLSSIDRTVMTCRSHGTEKGARGSRYNTMGFPKTPVRSAF